MDNNSQPKTSNLDIKTFLKIKQYSSPNSEEKKYYKVENNVFILFDPIRMQHSDKSINFQMNKVFELEENSYVYEEICRDVCTEALEGQNFCFITGGASKSGKKTLVYGKEDCKSEFSSRGLLYRLIENFLTIINKNSDLTMSMSMTGVYNSKYVDLIKFVQKNVGQVSEKDFVNLHVDIKPTQEVSNQAVNKIQIIEVNDIIDLMNKILEVYKNLDLFDRKLMTRTNFLNNLHIFKNGKLISTVNFCTLSGNEKIGLGKEFDGQKTRDSISNLNNEEALINIITLLKQCESDVNKMKEIPFQENPLTFCLKSFLLNSKLRIISCIFPGTGYINIVKNTLMFPFRIRKALLDMKNIKKEMKPEQKRDEEIYQLELQLNNQQKTIEKLKNDVANQTNENKEKEKTYKNNLEIIKKAFNFEGDIVKLLDNDEVVKEAIFARKIRESGDQVKYLNKKILELEKKIEDLKEENKTLEREKAEKKLDIAMVTLYNKLKEDNLLEENKIKIMLEHGKTVEKLKNENEYLNKQLEKYKKEIEAKSKLIKSLPAIMNENINEKKKQSDQKEELKNKLEKNYFDNVNKLKESHIKDITYTKTSYENNLKYKNEEIQNLKDEIENIKHKCEEDKKKYSDETIKIYEFFNIVVNNYKKYIDVKKIKNLGMLEKAKEDLDVIVEGSNRKINRTYFPLLFALIDEKEKFRFSKTSTNGFFKEKPTQTIMITDQMMPVVEKKATSKKEKPITLRSNIDQSLSASEISQEYEKLKPKKFYTYEELERVENNRDLMNIIFGFQQKIKEIENFLETVKNNVRKIVPPKDEEEAYKQNLLERENVNLRKKLEDQLKVNFNNKIIMESQERIIERYNTNNFLIKNIRPATGMTGFTEGAVSSPANKRTVSATTKNSVKFRPSTGRPLTSKEANVMR